MRTNEHSKEIFPLRPLDLHGGDIGFANFDVEVRVVRDALGPEEHVAVCRGEPESVLPESREDGAVDQSSSLVRPVRLLRSAELTPARVPQRTVSYDCAA